MNSKYEFRWRHDSVSVSTLKQTKQVSALQATKCLRFFCLSFSFSSMLFLLISFKLCICVCYSCMYYCERGSWKQRPEVDFECLSPSLSTLFFETQSLNEPRISD